MEVFLLPNEYSRSENILKPYTFFKKKTMNSIIFIQE